VEVQFQPFLTSTQSGGKLSNYVRFTCEERIPVARCVGRWIGRRAGMNTLAKRNISVFTANRTQIIQFISVHCIVVVFLNIIASHIKTLLSFSLSVW